jgi:hypothetical protein
VDHFEKTVCECLDAAIDFFRHGWDHVEPDHLLFAL